MKLQTNTYDDFEGATNGFGDKTNNFDEKTNNFDGEIAQASESASKLVTNTATVPNQEGVQYGGTSAFWENEIWYVHQHDRSAFKVAMCYCTKLKVAMSKNPQEKSKWSKDEKMDNGGLKKEIHTDTRPTVLTSGSNLFLFWADPRNKDHTMYATYREPNDKWKCEKKLLASDGKSFSGNSHDAPFHVISVIDGTLLLARTDGDSVFFYYFLAADCPASGDKWRASYEVKYDNNTISKLILGEEMVNSGKKVTLKNYTSIALFSQGGEKQNNTSGEIEEGGSYIVQSLCYREAGTDKAWQGVAITMPLEPLQDQDSPGLPLLNVGHVHTFSGVAAGAYRPFVIVDPGSRIRAYYKDEFEKGKLKVMTRSTDGLYGKGTWSDPEELVDPSNSSIKCTVDDSFTPCVTYAYGEPIYNGKKMERPVREYIFYANNPGGPTDHNYTEKFTWRDYGKLVREIDAETYDMTSASGVFFVDGFFDGPPPVPQENGLQNASGSKLSTATYDQSLEYGTEDSLEQSVKYGVRFQGKAGYELDGKMINIGGGISWNIATAQTQSWGAGKAITKGAKIHSKVYTAVDPVETNSILPLGELFARKIVLTSDLYNFEEKQETVNENNEPNYAKVLNAPQFSVIKADMSNVKSDLFHTRTSIPGDLESYLPDRLNARMYSIYKEMYDDKVPSDFIYLSDVVEKNAMELANGEKFLQCSWNISGESSMETEIKTTEFTHSAYKFESSVWAGVEISYSKGGLIKSKINAEVLAGVEYDLKHSSKNTTGKGFNIKSEVAPGNPIGKIDGVVGYSYKLYYLPPAPEDVYYSWTDELLYSLDDNFKPGKNQPQFPYPDHNKSLTMKVDSGSRCWKVMFVVDQHSIKYNDSIDALVDFGLPRNMVDKLKKDGIHTGAQLAASVGIPDGADLSLISHSDPYNEHEEKIRVALRNWNWRRK